MTMGKAANGTGQQRGAFNIDEEPALAELELAWADGGYHGFTAEGDTWSAVTGAGDVLSGATVDALAMAIRAHWQAMQ